MREIYNCKVIKRPDTDLICKSESKFTWKVLGVPGEETYCDCEYGVRAGYDWCEYCNSGFCKNCNEKDVQDMRKKSIIYEKRKKEKEEREKKEKEEKKRINLMGEIYSYSYHQTFQRSK